MATLTSSLVVRLIDQVTAPARAVTKSILGMQKVAGQGFGQRLNTAIERNNAALDQARGGMVDAVAGFYALKTAMVAPIKTAMDFESAMADIAKVSGFDDAGLEAYGKRLRKLATTEIPMAIADLAALSAAAAQAGVPDSDLFDFTRTVAKAAVAWEMSGAEAGEALAKIRTALGLTNEQTAAYADAVNFVADSMATNAPQLIDFTKRVAAQGEFYGFAKEQTLAFGGAMISAGFEADVAATSFRNMGRALTKGASATKAQRGAWRTLGMDATKVAKAMQKDAVGTTVKVIEKLGQVPDHMRASIMSDLFGDEASALVPLLSKVDQLRDALALTADEQKYLNSVGKEFEKRAATSAYKLQRFKSQLADIGLVVGNTLLPAMNELMLPLGEVAKKFSAWAEGNPELVRNIIATTGALVGFRIALAGLRFIGLMGRGGALSMLALGFNTVGKAAIGATRAAKSSIDLQRALGAMSGVKLTGLQTVGTALRGMVLAVPGVTAIGSALGAVGGALAAISAPAWGAVAIGVAAVAGAGALIWKYWSRISSIFSGVGRAVSEQFAPAIDAAKAKLLEWKEGIRNGVGNIAEYFGADAAAAKAAFDSMFDFSVIKAKFGEFKAWIGSFFQQEVLSDADKAAWEQSGYKAANWVMDGVKNGFTNLVSLFTSAPLTIAATAPAWMTAGVELASSMAEGAKQKISELVEWFRGLPKRILGAIGRIDVGSLIDLGGIKSRISSALGFGGEKTTPAAANSNEPAPAAGASGHRKRGGPVWPGGSFLVGEDEPEVFSPKTGGNITPMSAIHDAADNASSEIVRSQSDQRIAPSAAPRDDSQAQRQQAATRPASPSPSRQVPENVVLNFHGGINITGSADPHETKREVLRALKQEIGMAIRGIHSDWVYR